MKKVIVRLANGLGNQLFIYAAAYAFAKKNNMKLIVDNESGFYKRYKYELHNFNITSQLADKNQKFVGFAGRARRKFLKNLDKIKKEKRFLVENTKKNKLTFYNEEQFNIISGETLYFEGYFQSDKYFKSYKNDILNEFKFKEEVKNQKSSFIEMLQTKNSVSIHIRQDKFLKSEGHKDLTKLNKENLKISIKNALNGVRFFDKNLDSPKYFIWSNNFNDLREYFNERKFTFINENLQKDAAYDLYLMSLSKNFILSPSTLHYWGAFLSSNEKKICLAPSNILNKSGYYGFSNNKDIKADWWTNI